MERRIALISEHASPATALGSEDAGGQNVYVAEVSHHLADHGFQVDIFTRADDPALLPVQPWAPGVRLVHLRAGPMRKLPKDHLWRHMPAFRDALAQFAAQESNVYDVIYSHFWMSGWVATQLKPILEAPAVAIMHATGMTKRRFQGAADTSPAVRIAVERAMMQQVDALIAQCPAERDEFIHDYGVMPETIHLIPAGVDSTAFHPIMKRAARRQIGLDAAGPVVVYVGRILPRKDVCNIVRAIARVNATGELAPITLLVVGGANDPATRAEMAAITQLADALGVRLHCAGQQPQSVLSAYYCAGDVTVTTPWYEPFGLTPLESMACQRPVIGSAVGGLTATIIPCVTGALVPPRDPVALAATLGALLRQPQRLRRMGANGRQRVLSEYGWPIVAARTAALFESVLAQRVAATRVASLWSLPALEEGEVEYGAH